MFLRRYASSRQRRTRRNVRARGDYYGGIRSNRPPRRDRVGRSTFPDRRRRCRRDADDNIELLRIITISNYYNIELLRACRPHVIITCWLLFMRAGKCRDFFKTVNKTGAVAKTCDLVQGVRYRLHTIVHRYFAHRERGNRSPKIAHFSFIIFIK